MGCSKHRGNLAPYRGRVSSGRHRQDFRDNGRLPICARLGCRWRSDKIKLAIRRPLSGYGGQGPPGVKQYWRPRSWEGNARKGLCAWAVRVSSEFEMSPTGDIWQKRALVGAVLPITQIGIIANRTGKGSPSRPRRGSIRVSAINGDEDGEKRRGMGPGG